MVEDIIYGDARSRGEAAGRIVIAVADSVVGGTAMKAAKDAKKAAKAAKNAAKVVENVEDAAQTAKKIDKVIEEIAEIVDDIKGGSKAIDNAIPNVESATINPKKLTEYALNPNHPVGGNKAKVFESALGYNQSNADDLMRQIYEKLPSSEAVVGKLDQYGQRYTVDIPITGPNGNTVNVRTGWITKTGSDIPELTTIYVKD